MARTTPAGQVTVEHKSDDSVEPIKTVEEQPKGFPVVPKDLHAATVEVALGLTINMGHYESARIDVSLSVPCDPRRIDDVADTVKRWVERRVTAEAKQIRKDRSQHNQDD
jgi:hypothetical protein